MDKSPVQLVFPNDILFDLQKSAENDIYEAVLRYGVNVSKDELVKALAYDREQYDTGYRDGVKDTKPKWISVEERLPEHGQEVLCACRAEIYEVFKYVDGISGPWYKDSRHVYMKGFVTHWMPLPSTEGLNET